MSAGSPRSQVGASVRAAAEAASAVAAAASAAHVSANDVVRPRILAKRSAAALPLAARGEAVPVRVPPALNRPVALTAGAPQD